MRLTLAALLIATCPALVDAWSTDTAVSASVVAMFEAHEIGPDAQHLDLLVLWRGTPGWYAKGTGHAGSGGGGGAQGGRQWEYQQASYGGFTLTVEKDVTAKTAKILDRTISLGDVNVVLVDEADSSTGPIVVDARWIEPTITGRGNALVPLLTHATELRDFLRCHVGLPDATPMAQALQRLVLGPFCGQPAR